MTTTVRFLQRVHYLLFALCITTVALHGMVYDNRYLPLLRQPFIAPPDSTWAIAARPLFLWSNVAIPANEVDGSMDDEMPLFSLYGPYNEAVLNNALLATGQIPQTLFRSDLPAEPNVLWASNGKISFNGACIESEVRLGNYFAVGGSVLFGKLHSFEELTRDNSTFGGFLPGDEAEFVTINNQIHNIIGVTAPSYGKALFGDIDLYMRGGIRGDYLWKMRRIDLGVAFGFLIPTAPAAPYSNPAAISLGGNKHFGIYSALDGRFELKEDLTVGLLLRVNKRFARTSWERMVALTEPTNYGVLTGPLRVDPGPTLIAAMFLQFNCLRRGFGLYGGYTLVKHFSDNFCDRRADRSYKPNFDLMKCRSWWGSEHVTVQAFYDFGYDCEQQTSKPVIGVSIDIPVNALVEQRSAKSHGISIRIESRI